MGLTRTSNPANEPLSTAEAKSHLRVDTSDEDTYIASLVAAAREEAERVSWRALITQTWRLTLDRFPTGDAAIVVPRPPLQSVTSIQYVDENGDTQTVVSSAYDVDTNREPGRIVPAFGESWPSTRREAEAVTIVFVAGYGDDATDIPENTRHWLRLHVGHWHCHRGLPNNVMPRLEGLLDPVRDERLIATLA